MGMIRYLGELLNRPFIGAFYLYLALLWLLNIADVIQTLMLSQGGHLKQEANFFMNVFLEKDWEKADRWMEQRFEKNINQTPRKVASMYLNYSKMDSRMMPVLLKVARKVKVRVYMRKKRKGLI